MRALLLLILLVFTALPAHAMTDEEKDKEAKAQVERSVYAVDTFRKSCLVNFSDLPARLDALNNTYEKVQGEKRRQFLDFVHAADGDAWTAVISPKIMFTIVTDGGGNCYVLTSHAAAEKLHRELKNLAVDVRDSMSFSVVDYKGTGTPKGEEPKPLLNSGFDVKAPDGSIFFSVSATTKEDPKSHYANGVISIIAPKE